MAGKKTLKIDTSEMFESPTWRNVRDAAREAIEKLGGNDKARETLSWPSFYTLTLLGSLMMDGAKGDIRIIGK